MSAAIARALVTSVAIGIVADFDLSGAEGDLQAVPDFGNSLLAREIQGSTRLNGKTSTDAYTPAAT